MAEELRDGEERVACEHSKDGYCHSHDLIEDRRKQDRRKIDEHNKHIGDLLTFKNKVYGCLLAAGMLFFLFNDKLGGIDAKANQAVERGHKNAKLISAAMATQTARQEEYVRNMGEVKNLLRELRQERLDELRFDYDTK